MKFELTDLGDECLEAGYKYMITVTPAPIEGEITVDDAKASLEQVLSEYHVEFHQDENSLYVYTDEDGKEEIGAHFDFEKE